MSTQIITSDAMDDLKAVCDSKAANRPIDPVMARRIQERASEIKAAIQSRGMTNLGVELIREARDR